MEFVQHIPIEFVQQIVSGQGQLLLLPAVTSKMPTILKEWKKAGA